jgi:uncharacterized lipoprotein YajG
MFAAVRPRVESSNVFSATVVIEGGDQRSKDIIAGAVKKRGNILRASAEEIALAKQANRERVQSYFRL